MSHPPRFRSDDPYLAQLGVICLGFPQALEKVSHGHPSFYTRKVFAVFGGVVKGDHASTQWSQSVLVLPDAGERPALLQDPRFFDPAYYGPWGWVGLNFRLLGASADIDWVLVRELVDSSYRNTAVRKLVHQLDGRSAHAPDE